MTGTVIETRENHWDAKRRSIAALALAQVLALSLWFSGTAVVPALRAEAGLTDFQAAAFTSAVQIGFVAGTLVSALLGLADRLDPRRLFMASALVAGAANAALLLVDPAGMVALALRFVTGACMAGIYPVGMKIAASWARGDLGLLVGLLVGALSVGSASPHLIGALGGVGWRSTIAFTSLLAGLSALVAASVSLGPNAAAPRRFVLATAWEVWSVPSLRLVNLGYLGHMWELYALWAWVGVFLQASFAHSLPPGDAAFWAKCATFAVVAVGGIGCVLAGLMADRIGRTAVTAGALAISGSCALLAGTSFGAAPALTTALCLVWGASAVADSAQFSAAATELAVPQHLGTILTAQVCGGFTLTLLSIHLLPELAAAAGWSVAPAVLALGPAVGIWAMLRLRGRPEAKRLAGGRR
ncbi:MFS transporter [Azospirillum thermophilum]|uniref:MFS transporter n=1 Tax=Azospirillum thermophilum TaxID=2202148 RepID=A0A2S2CXJ4_9PROT|nr:MFS transporter [Azospirillum thermophilum]AWK88997.1 MFS transporter [Azospirillum thermophilum]